MSDTVRPVAPLRRFDGFSEVAGMLPVVIVLFVCAWLLFGMLRREPEGESVPAAPSISPRVTDGTFIAPTEFARTFVIVESARYEEMQAMFSSESQLRQLMGEGPREVTIIAAPADEVGSVADAIREDGSIVDSASTHVVVVP